MAAPFTRDSGIVFFTVPNDPDLHFAIRRADGRFWAANRFRGWRLMGVGCRRVRPLLVGGNRRLRVTIVPAPTLAA